MRDFHERKCGDKNLSRATLKCNSFKTCYATDERQRRQLCLFYGSQRQIYDKNVIKMSASFRNVLQEHIRVCVGPETIYGNEYICKTLIYFQPAGPNKFVLIQLAAEALKASEESVTI